tara:strand:+ start:70 stop:675 length:606 start_codon:yes stop_codon:yes gene_type:complete
MKARNALIAEAASLKTEIDKLSSKVYLNDAIKNHDDFKYLMMACQSNYKVIDPNNHEISFDWLRDVYIFHLPDVIRELNDAQRKANDLMKRVKERAPHILKVGKFSQSIDSIINKDSVSRTINDATAILNTWLVHNKVKKSGGGNASVMFSKVKSRVAKDSMSNEPRILGWNESAPRVKRKKRKKKISQVSQVERNTHKRK